VPNPSRILLVDDDDDGRSLVKEVLESDGYVVSEAQNGRVALELLTSALAPSLVIVDLEMPVMSGDELIDAMKRHEALARLPVLIVSGSGKTVIPMGEPVVGFLPKPLDVVTLSAKVKACIVASESDGDPIRS
jgi:CheY-like chemotaxis protein